MRASQADLRTGDANLDGGVDVSDLGRLATNCQAVASSAAPELRKGHPGDGGVWSVLE